MAAHHAGELRDRITLQRRALDDNNDRLGDWEGALKRWTKVLNLRGGEGVLQARLQGNQPVLLVVRADPETRVVDNSFRAINHRTRQIYDLSAASETPDRTWIEILGVAKAGEVYAGDLED